MTSMNSETAAHSFYLARRDKEIKNFLILLQDFSEVKKIFNLKKNMIFIVFLKDLFQLNFLLISYAIKLKVWINILD